MTQAVDRPAFIKTDCVDELSYTCRTGSVLVLDPRNIQWASGIVGVGHAFRVGLHGHDGKQQETTHDEKESERPPHPYIVPRGVLMDQCF